MQLQFQAFFLVFFFFFNIPQSHGLNHFKHGFGAGGAKFAKNSAQIAKWSCVCVKCSSNMTLKLRFCQTQLHAPFFVVPVIDWKYKIVGKQVKETSLSTFHFQFQPRQGLLFLFNCFLFSSFIYIYIYIYMWYTHTKGLISVSWN